MTDAAERGEKSREGYSEVEERHPTKRSPEEPNLTPPAAEEQNPPTNPELVGGLGEGGPAPQAPVPSGDPQKESDRSDLQ